MPDPGFINASAGAPAYTAAEMRQLFATPLQYNGRVMGARAGARPGGTGLETSLAGSTITVKAGLGIVDPALTSTQGPYLCALPTDETHTLTAAHGTFPRKDITILRVYDNDEDSSGLRLVRSEYIAGTASASPAEPAVPAGAIRLATIDVPQSGGGSATVTINMPFTVASGGILPVRTQAERDALSAFNGFVVYRQDRDWLEVHDGTAWRVQGVAVCSSTADRDSAITSPYNGQFAVTTDTGILWRRGASAWFEYPDVPRAQMRQTTVQSIVTGTYTPLTFTTEDHDAAGGHSTSVNTSRYTAQRAGRYRCSGAYTSAVTTLGPYAVGWSKNQTSGWTPLAGSLNAVPSSGAALHTICQARNFDVQLNVGDWVELIAWQNTGVTRDTVTTSEHQSTMSVLYVGPT